MSRLWFRAPAFHTHLTSFLWMFDLKVGATVITLFALFNKIAGLYGIIAIFQGGTFSQVTLYIYSLLTLVFFLWAMQGIADEDTARVLKYSHLFLADHLISTAWTFFFGLDWFLANKHDGEKPPLNEYQAGLMGLIESIESKYETSKNVHHEPLVGQARVDAAQRVWKGERSFSATVLILGWLVKIYFALVLYSYALHLRHGTYRSLPLSKSSGYNQANGAYHAVRGQSFELGAVEEEDLPAWSDEEDGEHHATSTATSAAATSAPARTATPSESAGVGIARPQSRVGRKGSLHNVTE